MKRSAKPLISQMNLPLLEGSATAPDDRQKELALTLMEILINAALENELPPRAVHGEFVLMQQLVFGISRGNVSANDNVSARRLSIPESRSAFLPSAPHDSGTRCNSL